MALIILLSLAPLLSLCVSSAVCVMRLNLSFSFPSFLLCLPLSFNHVYSLGGSRYPSPYSLFSFSSSSSSASLAVYVMRLNWFGFSSFSWSLSYSVSFPAINVTVFNCLSASSFSLSLHSSCLSIYTSFSSHPLPLPLLLNWLPSPLSSGCLPNPPPSPLNYICWYFV